MMEEHHIFRAKTAPVKLGHTLEEYKKTTIFNLIEKSINALSTFLKNPDLQFEIESAEGQMACKSFLNCLEELNVSLKCRKANRVYRQSFSKAYRILYVDDKLCYLTEILDSAQECKLKSGTDFICKW
jgi:hypothetical protein